MVGGRNFFSFFFYAYSQLSQYNFPFRMCDVWCYLPHIKFPYMCHTVSELLFKFFGLFFPKKSTTSNCCGFKSFDKCMHVVIQNHSTILSPLFLCINFRAYQLNLKKKTVLEFWVKLRVFRLIKEELISLLYHLPKHEPRNYLFIQILLYTL